jgi:DNA-directed RNA polymerase specialized sigma24 family protein
MLRTERWGPDEVRVLSHLYLSLRRFAAVVGRLDVEPDDLVQEVFVRVLRKDPESIRDLGPYLRRSISNIAVDHARRAKRRTTVMARMRPEAGGADAYPSELADLARVDARTRGLLYLVEIEGEPIAGAFAAALGAVAAVGAELLALEE